MRKYLIPLGLLALVIVISGCTALFIPASIVQIGQQQCSLVGPDIVCTQAVTASQFTDGQFLGLKVSLSQIQSDTGIDLKTTTGWPSGFDVRLGFQGAEHELGYIDYGSGLFDTRSVAYTIVVPGNIDPTFWANANFAAADGTATLTIKNVKPVLEEYCGDGICQWPESPADCPEDCPVVAPGPVPPPTPDVIVREPATIFGWLINQITAFLGWLLGGFA